MSELEKESLEAHVDLCSERYNGLHRELKNLGTRMDKFEQTLSELRDMMISMKADRQQATNQLGCWHHRCPCKCGWRTTICFTNKITQA